MATTATPSTPRPRPQPLPDLRHRRTRELCELIVSRAAWLPPEERALVRAIYADGKTAADLARIAGETPRDIRRRVRRLVARVTRPEFALVVNHRDRWPAPRRHIATSVVLQGRTLRATSRFLQLPYHAVRTEMRVVQALIRAA